jgi:hypothetical protein
METFRPRLLEVKVTCVPPLWRWQVLAGGNELATGFESAQFAAAFAGDSDEARWLKLEIT